MPVQDTPQEIMLKRIREEVIRVIDGMLQSSVIYPYSPDEYITLELVWRVETKDEIRRSMTVILDFGKP